VAQYITWLRLADGKLNKNSPCNRLIGWYTGPVGQPRLTAICPRVKHRTGQEREWTQALKEKRY
jgi:hypothetical protein